MVSFDSQFTCGCVWPNRDQEEDEPPLEGDDNFPLG